MKLHKIIHSDLVRQIHNVITDTFIRHICITRFCARGLEDKIMQISILPRMVTSVL